MQHGELEQVDIADLNTEIDNLRLDVRRSELRYGVGSPEAVAAKAEAAKQTEALQVRYKTLETKVTGLRTADEAVTVTLEAVDGQTKTLPLSRLVRFYPANDLTTEQKWSVYFSRWGEFITSPPREANTEGGVLPALVGTLTIIQFRYIERNIHY